MCNCLRWALERCDFPSQDFWNRKCMAPQYTYLCTCVHYYISLAFAQGDILFVCLCENSFYSDLIIPHCNPLQGQYRVEFTTQGKPCFHYREPLFSLQGPCIHHRESCIHYREFPVRITTQGNPCNHYREWVCSAAHWDRRLLICPNHGWMWASRWCQKASKVF